MKPSLTATQRAYYNITKPYEEIDETGLFSNEEVEAVNNAPQLKEKLTQTAPEKQQKISPPKGPQGMTNETNTAFLRLKQMVKKELGLNLFLTSGFRSIEKQSELYNKYISGQSKILAAKPGHSFHNFGLAFDVNAKDARGTVYGSKNPDVMQKIGAIGQRMGLVWGGAFKKGYDPVHFHIKGYNMKQLRRKNGLK